MIVMLLLLQNYYNIMRREEIAEGGKFKWNLFYTLHVYIFNVFFIGSSHVLNSMYIFVGHFLIILKDIQDTEAATGDVL